MSTSSRRRSLRTKRRSAHLRCENETWGANSPILGSSKRMLCPLDSVHSILSRQIHHLKCVTERSVPQRSQHRVVRFEPVWLLHLLLSNRVNCRTRMTNFELWSTDCRNVLLSFEVGERERLSTVRCCEGLEEDGRLGSGSERESVLWWEGGSGGCDEGLLGGCVGELSSYEETRCESVSARIRRCDDDDDSPSHHFP